MQTGPPDSASDWFLGSHEMDDTHLWEMFPKNKSNLRQTTVPEVAIETLEMFV